MVERCNDDHSYAVTKLDEDRPELCTSDSNSVEASLSFVEAARGRDKIDEHKW